MVYLFKNVSWEKWVFREVGMQGNAKGEVHLDFFLAPMRLS
jgi:hypothetical protein